MLILLILSTAIIKCILLYSFHMEKAVEITFHTRILTLPIPVAVRSKAWVYGRSLAGIMDSNPARGMDVCLL
jgi:hypothetical protein